MIKKRFTRLKVSRKLALALFCAIRLSAQTPIPSKAPLALLTDVQQLLRLTPTEAKARHPLQLKGVITYYDHDGLLFLQDATAGVYIWPGKDATTGHVKFDVHAGDIVEVRGASGPGRYSPVIQKPEFKVLGKGPMPEARKVSVGHLMTGLEDAQWVETEGIVWSVTPAKGLLTLYLADGANHIDVILSPGTAAPPQFLDRKVRVRGVCGVKYNERLQLTGAYLLSPDVSCITVTGTAPEEGRRVQPIDSLLRYSPESAAGHRVRVQGAVTLQAEGHTLFIQDETGGLRVQLQAKFRAQAGDLVEVTGFPQPGEYIPLLQHAEVKLIRRGARPVPLTAEAAQIQDGQLNARLVRLQGRILDHERIGTEQGLIVQAGKLVFKATIAEPSHEDLLTDFLNDSLVEVTGVCQSRLTGSSDNTFQLLLASPADIVVLKKPSWWNYGRLAWMAGIISLVSLAGIAWAIMLARANAKLQKARRELKMAHDELEARVQSRTAELASANASLEDEIVERKRVQTEKDAVHGQLLDASRQSGMAEVATSVLHNVGNVLNSVNVSCSIISGKLRRSRIRSITKTAEVMERHEGDLAAFFTTDPTGLKLPGFLTKLSRHLAEEQNTVLSELESLSGNIQHINDIVAMQQSYAKNTGGVRETLALDSLVEDALRLNGDSLVRHKVEIVREFGVVSPMPLEKHKVLQILVNLVRNAKHALTGSDRSDKRLAIRIHCENDRVLVSVRDNGIGIPAENLTRIFAHGFTTKRNGHGFGLHSGVLAAHEMGGRLTAHSEGHGKGATFTLELPLRPVT